MRALASGRFADVGCADVSIVTVHLRTGLTSACNAGIVLRAVGPIRVASCPFETGTVIVADARNDVAQILGARISIVARVRLTACTCASFARITNGASIAVFARERIGSVSTPILDATRVVSAGVLVIATDFRSGADAAHATVIGRACVVVVA